MPRDTSVTFRDQTTGRINDLLIDEHQACAETQNLLNYFAGELLNFKDEGIEFTPHIFVCDNIDMFMQSFPGSTAHKIGTAALSPVSGPKILKDCGPLTSSDWFIFVERHVGDTLNYGVFTYFRHPTANPIHEAIMIDQNQFCILIRKISPNTIELRGAKGNILTLVFSTTRDVSSSSHPIRAFALSCCSQLADQNNHSDFFGYFNRLLESSLTSSHGSILVCLNDEVDLGGCGIQDAVPVAPMLDFYQLFLDFQNLSTAGSILNLQKSEELLKGFLRCDGMIAFDSRA